jgi:hypothetical protein
MCDGEAIRLSEDPLVYSILVIEMQFYLWEGYECLKVSIKLCPSCVHRCERKGKRKKNNLA